MGDEDSEEERSGWALLRAPLAAELLLRRLRFRSMMLMERHLDSRIVFRLVQTRAVPLAKMKTFVQACSDLSIGQT